MGKQCGPLCASKVGKHFIDPGTSVRTRSPQPGPLDITRAQHIPPGRSPLPGYDDPLESYLRLRYPRLHAPPPPPIPDIRRGKYVFPVRGDCKYSDTWGDPRGGGRRQHHGVDIFAEEGTEVCAVTDGYITLLGNWPWPPVRAGLTVRLDADDTYRYEYMHLKNFHPSIVQEFGGLSPTFYDRESIKMLPRGRLRVKAGRVLGEVGRTGFRSSNPADAHLHFQAFPAHGRLDRKAGIDDRINPYSFLAKLSGGPQQGEPANVRHYFFK